MCLCAKAALAMEESGGILQVRLNDVMLESQNDAGLPGGAYIELLVTDTGRGIPEEQLQHLLQAEPRNKSTDIMGDTGLPMAYDIIQGIGGEIRVQSQEGAGTVFQVYFPVYQENKDLAPYPKKTLPKGDERILFVDDEEAIVKMALRTLTNLGYDVTALDNSVEALKLITQKHDFFDLIITDMTMPKITGERLVKEIRAIHPTMPIILLSGYSPLLNPEKIETMAIQAFLSKPFLKENLAVTVRRVLDSAITGS
jgi:CheY-like chemotaxis protein